MSVLERRKMEIGQITRRGNRTARADLARCKAVLGAFMVAQFRHRPALHAELVPDLRAHLAAHPRSVMAEANIAFMSGLLDDPAWSEHAGHAGDGSSVIAPQQARRNRARRMILVGAWVLDRRGRVPAIDALIGSELARFLEQDRTPERNIALLRETLGPF